MAATGLEDICQVIITKIIGKDWQIQPIDESLTKFEVTLADDALSAKQAWEKSYELRSQPDVIDVEPLFTVPVVESRDAVKLQPQAIFDSEIDRESNDVQWGLEQMGVLQVWQQYFLNQLPRQGIVALHICGKSRVIQAICYIFASSATLNNSISNHNNSAIH